MTLQKRDILWYKGEEISIWGNILSHYFEIYPERLFRTPGFISSLLRGYYSEFKIENNELIITSLERFIGFDEEIKLLQPYMKKYTAEDIRTIDGNTHVRLRPKMYFEECFENKNLNALPFEVLCHAFDEYFDKNCDKITLDISNNSFKITYNAGMSLEQDRYDENLVKAEIIMSIISACSNLKKHLAVGKEFCRLGMATINAASKICRLTTIWKDKKGIIVYEEGTLKSKEISTVHNKASYTEIYIQPDEQLFGDLEFTAKGIQEKVNEISKRLPNLDFKLVNHIV